MPLNKLPWLPRTSAPLFGLLVTKGKPGDRQDSRTALNGTRLNFSHLAQITNLDAFL